MVRLAYCASRNQLGEVVQRLFPSLSAAVAWGKENVPACSAGWSVYSVPDSSNGLPETLYDYRA